jgi:hypothetical protein
MKIDGLAMPSLHRTLMGVLKGALDYYGIETSIPTVFGASGHAFLINIHDELCPSGPYCWNRELADPLIKTWVSECMTWVISTREALGRIGPRSRGICAAHSMKAFPVP